MTHALERTLRVGASTSQPPLTGGRAVSWLTLIAGTIGISVSLPIALSHYMKRGISLTAVVWTCLGIGSIYLVYRGASGALRRTRRWAKLLAIPIAFALLQFVVYPLGMAVYTTRAASPEPGSRTPSDVGLTYEDLDLVADDGSQLAAWYVPPENGAVIVLRHGSGSTRTSTLDHAAFLAGAGYGVLMMDARGHGASDGSINELGWHGPADIRTAVDRLSGLPEVERIGLLGLSMGGEEALKATAADDRIDAVVAEGAGIGTYEDSIALGAHAMARFINWTQYRLTELLSDADEPAAVATSMPRIEPRSVLLIAGSPALELEIGRLYARRGGANVHLWQLPDTPHTAGLRVHRQEYVARVLGLFDAALLGSPAT